MRTSEGVSVLLGRAQVYSFVSGLFSDPDNGKFQGLKNKDAQKDFMKSCEGFSLTSYASRITHLLNHTPPERIKREHVAIFGHTLSKDNSLYEMEFLKNKEVFSLTQALADITGFYSAFGLQVETGERSDHLGVEAEFLSFLMLKEALALENNLPFESVEVCHQACKDFSEQHFFLWTCHLAENLIRQTVSPFYKAAGEFLKRFIEFEKML